MGLIILACLIAFLTMVAYRRRKLRHATAIPEREAAEKDTGETSRAMEDIELQEIFLAETEPECEVQNNKEASC